MIWKFFLFSWYLLLNSERLKITFWPTFEYRVARTLISMKWKNLGKYFLCFYVKIDHLSTYVLQTQCRRVHDFEQQEREVVSERGLVKMCPFVDQKWMSGNREFIKENANSNVKLAFWFTLWITLSDKNQNIACILWHMFWSLLIRPHFSSGRFKLVYKTF